MTKLAKNKTKIVCTIGPASDSPEMIEQMIEAGMNVARLNFSHGDFTGHAEVIGKIRAASDKTGKRVAIMADLPGPKMRIGIFEQEPVHIYKGDQFVLTRDEVAGTRERVSITLKSLPQAVRPGNIIFLADGLIQLRVDQVQGNDIICTVVMGGELRSKKRLNIPGIDLGVSVFTPRDRECMQFALEHGVDAISQSFVSSAEDIKEVRRAAKEMGFDPFIIAKVERACVKDYIDEILVASDGIMVARGDLGVEIPIEKIAVAQKFITRRANLQAKPVITATQMLESMTSNPRPTRAEATDVANAILDGTDCIMLSGESAMGDYPLESVKMLAKIAAATEPHRPPKHYDRSLQCLCDPLPKTEMVDAITGSVESIMNDLESTAAILTPTTSGHTARSLTRFRLEVWILAISQSEKSCQELLFSYGVWPILKSSHCQDWTEYARTLAGELELSGKYMIQTEGPSPAHPATNHRMEIIALS